MFILHNVELKGNKSNVFACVHMCTHDPYYIEYIELFEWQNTYAATR